jgi:hypothetical protein
VAATERRDARAAGPTRLVALDAHAWAFVHFLVWADRGAYAPLLDKYVNGVLNGADPVASVASTLGDVSRFETAFDVYVSTRRVLLREVRGRRARVARAA